MKTKITSIALVAALTLAPAMSWAGKKRVLLVSDIDDTIKVSHILNWSGKLTRAANITTPFRGMSELFHTLKQQNHLDVRVAYVSNAPERIAGMPLMDVSHRSFLSMNQFPYGDMFLRADLKDENHKIRTLRQLMKEQEPEVVILFGDNGEKDPQIYRLFFREFSSDTRVITFIHQLYSSDRTFQLWDLMLERGSKLHADQIGYVTPIEVALELKRQQIIGDRSYRKFVNTILPQILRETWIGWDGFTPMTFPQYKKCTDFRWQWGRVDELLELRKKISRVCR
ncbi:phosphatase domain-containing protein [Pseudobdellovibrio exovorus]|uniref:Phosphatidate phosphatase APP1 catalytic domain-containing protein n=1 Tax=Pseudobdellovibrio exovorus JSS TaxID=1184267 RepID=M4VQY0_9BACT|nr:phosphatase domain-containing protein [Pseudobdellovibrio exovorus]AGH95564.1 hypothetical protein A11Q_1348 [Pseudobdellovibrio exovorus JSS]